MQEVEAAVGQLEERHAGSEASLRALEGAVAGVVARQDELDRLTQQLGGLQVGGEDGWAGSE